MANINLGNIRRLGFIKGLADSELARQAAQAKIAEEDRAYQRLLKRDEETRAFQSAEAEKTRAASAEQARLTRKQAERAANRAYSLSLLDYREKKAARLDAARTKKETTARTDLSANLNALGDKYLFEGKKFKEIEAQLIARYGPILGKTFVTDQIQLRRLGNKAKLNEGEREKLRTNDLTTIKDLGKGAFSTEKGVEAVYTPKMHERARSYGNFTDVSYEDQLNKFKMIAKRVAASKQTVDNDTVAYELPDGEVVKFVTTQGYQPFYKNKKANQLIAQYKSRLNQYENLFRKMSKAGMTDSEIKKHEAFQSFKNERDLLQSTTENGQNIYTLKNYKTVHRLVEGETDVPPASPAGPVKPIRDPSKPEVPEQKYDSFQDQRYPRNSEQLSDASSFLVASKTQDGVDLSLGGFDPQTDSKLINMAQARKLMEAWSNTRYRKNDELDALVTFMRNSGISKNGQEVADITDAVMYLEPDKLMRRERGGSLQTPIANDQVYDTLTEGAISDFKKKAQDQLNSSNEALNMITTLEGTVQLIETNPLGFGAELEMITSDIRSYGKGIAEFAGTALGNLGEKFKSSFIKVFGEDNDLETIKRRNTNAAIRAENNKGNFMEVRNETTAYYEDIANKMNAQTDELLRKGIITKKQAGLRKLVVLQKMALTYRLSGLFQGDSSGRTISNQDYDVAASALWGEGYSFGPKMEYLKQFFEARNRRFSTIADSVDSRTIKIASRVQDSVARLNTSHFIQNVLGKGITPMFQSGATTTSAINRSDVRIKIRDEVNTFLSEAMEENEDESVKNIKSLAELGDTFGILLTGVSRTENVPDGAGLIKKTTLPKTKEVVDTLKGTVTEIFKSTYPNEDVFKNKYPDKDYNETLEGMINSVIVRAYNKFASTRGN